MNILIFNWRDLAHPEAGGAEVYVHSIAREWLAVGHAVSIFSAAVPGKPPREMASGVEVIRRGGKLGVYREARQFWQKEGTNQFDLVVDSVNTRPFLSPSFVDQVPVVAIVYQTAADVWDYETPWPVSWLGRHLLEPRWLRKYRYTPVVTISNSSRQALDVEGLRNVTVIPVGWNPPLWSIEETKEQSPTLLFVGRLSKNKRPQDAVRAFEIVRRSVPDCRLWIVGDGPEANRLHRRLPPGVLLLGKVSDVEKYQRMARAHALISTSVREGWGLVITEAAAMGTPSFAYNVPGLRDSVSAAKGILTDPEPSALAANIISVLTGKSVMPVPSSRGTITWPEVARRIIEFGIDGRVA